MEYFQYNHKDWQWEANVFDLAKASNKAGE